jgi:hypothetical protein
MTFPERNKAIDSMICKFRVEHLRYTQNFDSLTDKEWEEYIHSMDKIANDYKGTNLEQIAGAMCMTFLNDTEMIQKKLKAHKEKEAK